MNAQFLVSKFISPISTLFSHNVYLYFLIFTKIELSTTAFSYILEAVSEGVNSTPCARGGVRLPDFINFHIHLPAFLMATVVLC